MSKKGLLPAVSRKGQLMKNVCVIHFSISRSGKNLTNRSHAGHLSTSSGAGKLLDWCQLVLWPRAGKSVAGMLTAVLANTFREVVAFIPSKPEEIVEVSMFSLNLSKQARTVRFRQLGSMVESAIRMIITAAAPTSDNFWEQTSVQTSTCLEAYLLPLTLPFIPKLRCCLTRAFSYLTFQAF